jgi:hypothetical protein
VGDAELREGVAGDGTSLGQYGAISGVTTPATVGGIEGVTRGKPPNLRESEGASSCGSCRFFGADHCELYGWPVDAADLCDSYSPTGALREAGLPSKEMSELDTLIQEAVLTGKARKALGKGSFAVPESRSYPIHDEAHAKNALSRVAQHGSPEEKARVRRAVCAKFPKLPSCQQRKVQEAITARENAAAEGDSTAFYRALARERALREELNQAA